MKLKSKADSFLFLGGWALVVIGLGLEGFGFCLAGLGAFLVSLLVVEPGG